MKILTELQSHRLLTKINLNSPFGKRDHAMIRLALQTGLRVGELSSLCVEHVAVQGKPREFLDLPAELTKYNHGRVVPLSPGARRAVAELLAFNRSRGFSTHASAPLLQNRFHRPLSVRSIQKLVEAYRDQAQLDVKVTPHTLRHTMATRFLQHSGNLFALKEAMGWRKLDTALVYLHPSREQTAKDFQTFPDQL
jgi:integrase/recombinase XerD